MESLSHTEENYLKAIFKLTEHEGTASTNGISQEINISAASVTDMLKRLAEKDLIHYEKYKGVKLTEKGLGLATRLVRKHRLWEVFLVEKLNFSWDKVHDIAEQLEHIRSAELVERLDTFLGYPKFDPHGDPIPDSEGKFTYRQQTPLELLRPGDRGVVVGVQDHSPVFLQYLERLGLVLGVHLEVLERIDYDESMHLRIPDRKDQIVTKKVCQNLFIQKEG